MKYIIKETYEVIEAYSYSTYEVEANSEDEAIEMINNNEIDPVDFNIDVQNTEFMDREITLIKK